MSRRADAAPPASGGTGTSGVRAAVSGRTFSTRTVLGRFAVAEARSGQVHLPHSAGACWCGWAGGSPGETFLLTGQQECSACAGASLSPGSGAAQHQPGGSASRRLTRTTSECDRTGGITLSRAAGRPTVRSPEPACRGAGCQPPSSGTLSAASPQWQMPCQRPLKRRPRPLGHPARGRTHRGRAVRRGSPPCGYRRLNRQLVPRGEPEQDAVGGSHRPHFGPRVWRNRPFLCHPGTPRARGTRTAGNPVGSEKKGWGCRGSCMMF